MGCDIHAYIDYNDFEKKDGDWYVSGFSGRINFQRNYTLFGLMAGVRGWPSLFKPRGIPKEISWRVRDDFVLVVARNDEQQDIDGFCSKDSAERWVARGLSKWEDNEHTCVTHPDWHTASWLTTQELEHVQQKFNAVVTERHVVLDAVIAAMKSLDGDTSGRSRLVFWFDN